MAQKPDLNEQFQFNLMLAKAVVQLMPETDRQHIRIWFEILSEMDETQEQMVIRNDYIWFILQMLQSNKIIDYFKDWPPKTIQPLRDAIPQKAIDDVILAVDQNMSWLDRVSDEEKEKNFEKKKIPPDQFLKKQPLPKEGIICYFGAFSDQG